MAQMTSGKVLAEARERKGYDLPTVARRLRIRPDILRAIEEGDFSAMPPRGYTRNMVNAYARLLGLNQTEIVDMYLDEAYANQVQKARDKAPVARFNMERDTIRSRRAQRNRIEEDTYGTSSVRSSYLARDLYDDRTRFSRDDYGLTREARVREGRSDRDFLSHHSGYPSNQFSFMDEQGSRFSRGREIRVGSTPMQYSASRMPSFLQNKIALVAAIVLAIVIIVAIVLLVMGNFRGGEGDDVSKLPVSGINDTTQTGSEEAADAVIAIAPTSAHVTYKASSDDCYVEIQSDSGDWAGYLVKNEENTVEVTGTWRIATYYPDSLTVTVDGEKQSFEASEDTAWMSVCEVDFPAILEAWEEEHPEAKGAKRAAANASATAAQENAEAYEDEEDYEEYEEESEYDEESYDEPEEYDDSEEEEE